MGKCVVMDLSDNVATVLKEVEAGEKIKIVDSHNEFIGELISREQIPFAHKISIAEIQKEGYVIKYGEIVGSTLTNLSMGSYVHVHNTVSIVGSGRQIQQK